MDRRQVDVAIIGAGTAGLTAYNAARKHTDKLVLIEGGSYGTTCARVGCMPSKLLIAAAEQAHNAAQSGLFGIEIKHLVIDGRSVLRRVRNERDIFVASVLKSMTDIPDAHKLRGTARFLAPGVLAVDDEIEITAARIVIATGSSPHIPNRFQGLGNRLLTTDSLFELADLPKRIAVFGGGAVGLELGQALSRLGVDVSLFGHGGAVAGIADPQIREYARKCFNQAFFFDADANVTAISADADQVSVSFSHPVKGAVTESFDYLLLATGRSPNLASLKLQNSGLKLNEKGVPLTDPSTLQCDNQPVFLVGDANQQRPVLHEAAHEGRIAGDNAGRYPALINAERYVPFSVVFTSPQIARIGTLPCQLPAAERENYVEASSCFEDQGRSKVIAKNQGILKVYARRDSGVFTAAEMFGPAAEHIGHLLAWAAQQQMTVSAMLAMPFYHPVIEEGVRTALKDLQNHLDKAGAVVNPCLECGPGT